MTKHQRSEGTRVTVVSPMAKVEEGSVLTSTVTVKAAICANCGERLWWADWPEDRAAAWRHVQTDRISCGRWS